MTRHESMYLILESYMILFTVLYVIRLNIVLIHNPFSILHINHLITYNFMDHITP